MRDPKKYGRFRRENDRLAPGVHAIWGITAAGKVELQAIRFDKEKFSAAEARAWLKAHDFRPILFEEAAKPQEAKSMADQNEIAAPIPGAMIRLAAGAGSAEILAAMPTDEMTEEEKKKAAESAPTCKAFRMVGYTGAEMELGGWIYPVVVDLAGLKIGAQAKPILLNHEMARIVGHSKTVKVEGNSLLLTGLISGASEDARAVEASSLNGFPWQASIGAKVKKMVFVPEGKTGKANGKDWEGPVYLVKSSTLQEVSFVALGADSSTSAAVAAAVKMETEQERNMDGEQETVVAAGTVTDPIAAVRAESARIASIQAVGAGEPEIVAQAIKEGWGEEKAELAVLKAKAKRREQDAGITGAAERATKEDLGAIKAAVCMGAGKIGEAGALKAFGEKAVNNSDRFRRAGIKALMASCIEMDGGSAPRLTDSVDAWVRAAFSSTSFSDLLSDSANKTLLAAYSAVPSAARIVARALTANDFKAHKGVRLTGDLTFKKVTNGGEIEHGNLGDDTFSYSVDTFGRMIGLTRQDMVNDDLGAFLQLPQMFGRGAALAVESAFWTLVLANTGTFFGSGNANYISGSTTNLSSAGLRQAVQKLEEQTDPDGNPVALMGKYLVVPPALKYAAQQLYASVITKGNTDEPDTNVFAGAYLPVSTPYIKAAAKVWYLFGDPADVAAFGIAWLNGVQAPIVEEVAVSGEYLGRAWRGYIDFGVCQIDPRGAVMSKGEA